MDSLIINFYHFIRSFFQKKSPAARYSVFSDTFATTVLNFCVRDGNRCVHRAITTRLFFRVVLWKLDNIFFRSFLFTQSYKFTKILSPRSISITRLNVSLHLHLWPINLLTLKGSYSCDGKSHLKVGFTLRCFQRLSVP